MKRSFRFNKLVRDKVVDIITKHDRDSSVTLITLHKLEDKIEYFKSKVLEEAVEVVESTNELDLLEELADLQEVISTFIQQLGIPIVEFKRIRNRKNQSRGSFNECMVVDYVTVKEGHPMLEYYLNNPQKYPEIKKNQDKP